MSGRAVAATAGPEVGYRRVSQVLAELVDAGLVLQESQPPTYLYRLNRDHVAAEAVEILEDLRERLLRRIAQAADSWEIATRSTEPRTDGSTAADDRGDEGIVMRSRAPATNLTVIARYDRRGKQARRRDAKSLHVRYIFA